ncbi:MAG: nucleotide-binding protein [Alphaproteobacteria bacterium]|nr:nucleotide-binding protein [Alphaproteobacteria bacterium]
MKTRIFIGSSTEGIEIAKKIQEFFSKDYECVLWTNGVFNSTQSVLETLLRESEFCDFGIMLFTNDDYMVSRNNLFESARDNVIFEYGLFLGRLGLDKAIVICENGVKVPSDFLGFELAKFDKSKSPNDHLSLEKCLENIKKQIIAKEQLGFLHLLPSTTLAIGYFDNFVNVIIEALSYNGFMISNESEKYPLMEFDIILPQELRLDPKQTAQLLFNEHYYGKISIEARNRNYPLYFRKPISDKIILYDMPTTLYSAKKALDLFLRKGHIGNEDKQIMLEARELSNFEHVLQILIDENPYCNNYVNIKHIEQIPSSSISIQTGYLG